MPNEETQLLRRMLESQKEVERITTETDRSNRREAFLQPFRAALEKADTKARATGQTADVAAYRRAKANLIAAQADADKHLDRHEETDKERYASLRSQLEQAQREEDQTRKQIDGMIDAHSRNLATPGSKEINRQPSNDLRVKYSHQKAHRADLQKQLATLEKKMRAEDLEARVGKLTAESQPNQDVT